LSHKDARVHCVVLNIRAGPFRCRRLSTIGRRFVRGGGPHRQAGLRAGQNARALRTQQRVRRPSPLATRSTAEASTSVCEVRRAPNNRCSTLEHLPSNMRRRTRLWIACATSAP
jgi:hypothetical protein